MDKMRVKEELKQNNQESQKAKQIQQQQQPPPPAAAAGSAATASPPSASSSPSHEFSFTISFNQNISTKTPENNKTKQNTPPSSFAIDLTPADDIFFHGHLLPLHLLSHLPVSPRSSTNSIDSSLPIKELLEEKKIQNSKNQKELNRDDDNSYYDLNHSFHHPHQTNSFTTSKDQKPKSKSFSLFGLPKKKKEEKEDKEKQRKLKFDVSQVLKRYMRMVRPFLSFRSRKNMQFNRQSYSYSGNLSFRSGENKEIRGIKRGAYSAPVSMKNSPTNSGLLVATPGANYHNSSSSDSTMEELQSAIQAAIAHCKKSSSLEQKIKCQEND
ncbi:PREDICTED: BRI1 kinase inhibitor 1-like [Nicotiana attenuata]|uniref:Bri1 kinase inhibitor 1 n=1 Tax=Nicotiana attenuata TaxID=49451 RepID=A0A1J6IIG6_NICAT|nr:PREDICTED: BRI1 kinase inhibitor 1-like [Nicotiana attenuata]OIT04140.1 bri1 kinase inhibitor 1 [Nicotiana attenuata]